MAEAGKFLRGTADSTGCLVILQLAQTITNAIMGNANLLVGITIIWRQKYFIWRHRRGIILPVSAVFL
jgi:hypothetical protein